MILGLLPILVRGYDADQFTNDKNQRIREKRVGEEKSSKTISKKYIKTNADKKETLYKIIFRILYVL